MSQYNPKFHNRRSMRLQGYDYSKEGLYFITICCQDGACLFGKIHEKKMMLNSAGEMIHNEWVKLPMRFHNVILHEFVVMPNHFHGILEISTVGASPCGYPVANSTNANSTNANSTNNNSYNDNSTKEEFIQQSNYQFQTLLPQEIGHPQGDAPTKHKTLSDMMDAFKSITTVNYIHGVKTLGWVPFNGKMWQRNYYDHIIRNNESYQNISQYINNNPANWENDKFYRS